MKRCLSTGNLSTNDSTNDSFSTVTNNKKAKRQRQKLLRDQISTTQPLTPVNNDFVSMSQADMDSVINSVVNQTDIDQTICVGSNSTTQSMHASYCKCDMMKTEVDSLNNIITQLKVKVDFLMSYLGLEDVKTPTNATIDRTMQSADSEFTAIQPTQPNPLSYAAIASKTTTKLSGPLRQAVMSAVYSDLHSKSTRSNNIIVSGLPKSDNCKDEDMVCELFVNEFSLQPTIKHCRRLGKVVAEKTQNLVVTLESSDHVKSMLSNAKQLRSSNNNFVRNNIFINADLTKAEATVAYEERCRKRHQRAMHPSRQVQHGGGALTTTTTAQSVPSLSGSLSASGTCTTASANSTSLNATVPEFLPATSAHSTASQSTSTLPSTSSAGRT